MKNILTFLLRKLSICFFLFILLSPFFLCAQNAADPDTTFDIGTGPDADALSTAIQADGKIIICGFFTSFNGVSQNYLTRLNTDGTLDNTFNIGTGADNFIGSIAIQADGKIIIGGGFTTFNGVSKNYLARLNADGTLDNTFNIGVGADSYVKSIAIQADGKIIIGGWFTTFNGVSKKSLARLNDDGTLDNTFNIGVGANNVVRSIAIQADGKIIIGGDFTTFNGVSKNYLARLDADGTLDNTFKIGTAANTSILSIAIQADSKIIIGGWFTIFNGVSKNYLARLNVDGTLDNTFKIGTGANSYVESIAIQADGKIIIGGAFTSFNGIFINLPRINSDGSLDNTFNIGTGTNSNVSSIAIQADGKIIIGGSFTSYQGIPYNYIARLRGNPIFYNKIRGNIYTDSNQDCIFQTTENHVPGVIVKALPGPFYGGSDAYGKYQLRVDSGTVNYTLSQVYNSINSKLLINQCASSQTISLTGSSKDTCCFNFADSVKQCALLNISIQKTRARRCFRNSTYVNYTNYGNASAAGTQIKIEYPSEFIPLSSIPMWSSQQGSVLIYNRGTLPAGTSEQIVITDSVSCIANITGLTECIQASISPATNCVAENPAWDKSSMNVTGSCSGGNAHFTISNHGTSDMASTLPYRVYENDSLIFTGTYQLNSGESFTVDYPAQGQTIRVEADQHALHPGKSRPRATIENCGLASPEVRNLITTAPQDDLDEETAITCTAIVDSYDPNDKLVLPKGIGPTNMVAPGTELEYTIRFQNTGTDTAYTVTVVDTLDAGFDVASFTQGTSSHPYTLGITGKGQAVLSFRFDQINLPDSTKNEPASSGLVSFRMTVPSSAPIGTVIKNKAYIYFDYNTPVLTNETIHTVDNTVPPNLSKGSAVQVGATTTNLNGKKFIQAAKIFPNPTTGNITVEIPHAGNSELRIMTLPGVLQKSIRLSSDIQEVSLEGLTEGMYLYEIWENGERKTGGKLLKE
jgi:uncharacterized delta-60 repeat protein/uncharacterized repeat protein (TIGR01451 family)